MKIVELINFFLKRGSLEVVLFSYFLNETYSNHFGDYKMVELCHVQI